MNVSLSKSVALVLVLLGVALGLPSLACADSADSAFHIFAPSSTAQQLLIVEAKPVDDKLSLKLTRRVDLGFPGRVIAAHGDKPLFYVAPSSGEEGNTPGAVIRLNPDGSYAKHRRVKLAHGYSYLSLDRTHGFLLGANYRDGFVDVYSLAKDGLPAKHVAALNEGRRNAHCVLTTPDNRFVYIPYVKDTGAIFQYRFNEKSGGLQALEPKNANPPAGTGPRHIAYHPKKSIVYFSNEQHLGVSAYDIGKSGQLKLRQVCDAVGQDHSKEGVSSSDIVITPDGRFLFAGIRGHRQEFDRISRYRIKPRGDVELLGLTPADKIPWGLALSPCGRYLLATGFKAGTLMAFRIGENGSLTRAGTLEWDEKISDLVTR